MKIIRTKFFDRQLKKLWKIYKNSEKDYIKFSENITCEPFSDLWNWFYKYRLWNTSIPSWKRWWFRIIVKIHKNKLLPIFIYSKTIKENISENEIIEWLNIMIKELST